MHSSFKGSFRKPHESFRGSFTFMKLLKAIIDIQRCFRGHLGRQVAAVVGVWGVVPTAVIVHVMVLEVVSVIFVQVRLHIAHTSRTGLVAGAVAVTAATGMVVKLDTTKRQNLETFKTAW